MEGATGAGLDVIGRLNSFNPRPRGGGDELAQVGNNVSMVSIHAPVEGATPYATF